MRPDYDGVDGISWVPSHDGNFTIKSSYNLESPSSNIYLDGTWNYWELKNPSEDSHLHVAHLSWQGVD